MLYLDEHGPLRLHDHLQERFDQSLRCGGDQVEKVNDGRTDLHLLDRVRKKRGGGGGEKTMEQDTDITSDTQSRHMVTVERQRMNLSQTTENAVCAHKVAARTTLA